MTIKKQARRRTNMSTSEAQAHDESFKLIMARFDKVDQDNKEISDKLEKHIDEDFEPVKSTVGKHTTYWALLMWVGSPFILGGIAWLLTMFGK